jgi:hypothetical protein
MDFNQAEERFRGLKARFAAGDMSEAEFKAQLEELMVEDAGGTWWMLGYETERWYRYDGTSWVQEDPPGRSSPQPDSEPAPESRREIQAGPMEAAAPPAAAPRRLPIPLLAAALIVLVVGGYFVFRSAAAKPTPTAAPTEAPVLPVVVKPTQATSTPEPTAQPSETPTPGIEFSASAVTSQLFLYQGPDLRYGKLATYPKGEKFTVLARDERAQWLLVSAADGMQGWVYFQWVDADFDVSLLPTPSVAPPALPTPTRKPKDAKPTACSFGC